MKTFKYLIFLSILSGMFFVIYRQSDQKAFRRCRTSFKTAAIIAASLAGLVSESAEAQEFHLYENTDQQVILARRDSSGTPSPSNIGRQGQSPSNFPTSPSGGRRPSWPITGINPYRHLHVNPGTAGNPGGAGNGGADNYNDDSGIPKIPQELKTYDYDYRSNLKKKESAEQCELNDNLNNMPEFGPILEGSVVPVESLLGISSGFKAQYKNLKKNSIAHKQATASIEKLAAGSLKIGDKNIRKIRGMKNIYEAKSKYARVYFQINGDTVQIILPALKIDQKQSLKPLKKYFK